MDRGSPRLERLLARAYRPLTNVEPREAITASVMTLIVFVLLTGYYLLKTAREPLILLSGGAEAKLYIEAGQALLLVGVVRVYGAIARRVGRMKLLGIVYVFFTSNMIVFALLARAGVPIGIPFFFWVGLFSYTAVAQFWAFAADIYTQEQGERLFPLLGVGSSVGAVLGARIAKALVPLGPQALMFGAALATLVCVALIAWVERRAGAPGAGPHEPKPHEPLAHEGAFHLLARDKYLLLIGALTMLLNWVNSSGEYILDRSLLASVADARARGVSPEHYIASFKASYFAWYNGLGLAVQLFAVSRVIAKLGVRNALLFLPAIALLGYGAFTIVPALALIRLAKIAENGLDYSLQNTARHALFLVSSRAEKYVGKTLVDTVAVRVGDVVSAIVVWIGVRARLPLAAFSAIAVALTLAWIAIAFALGREHARRSGEGEARIAEEPALP